MASRPQAFVLEVTFEPREDGGLRAYCDKVPSFVLSHSDPAAVLSDVEPALAAILSAIYGLPMSVRRASEIGQDATAPAPLRSAPAQYVGILEAA